MKINIHMMNFTMASKRTVKLRVNRASSKVKEEFTVTTKTEIKDEKQSKRQSQRKKTT